jgi:signal transduction histidine kinase
MNPGDEKTVVKNKEDFFLFASHELRTPLTAIRAGAELLISKYSDKISDPDMKELLSDIDIASIRLIRIINNFLDPSHLENGAIHTKKENFNIADAVRATISHLKILAAKKNITLSYESDNTTLPDVFADKDIVEQILTNLIGNAIKFTSEGGVTLTSEVAGDFVKITVSDTGIGISKEDQALLFGKFKRVGENHDKQNCEDSGLGLYISQTLIGAIGGNIALEKSEPGKGSVFAFTIPIAK